MTEQTKDNPYCHQGMTCAKGCVCASEDGICHCDMLSDDKCTCNGYCGNVLHQK